MQSKIYTNLKKILTGGMLAISLFSSAQLPNKINGLSPNSPFGMDMSVNSISDKCNIANDLGIKWVRGVQNDYFANWNGDKNDLHSKIQEHMNNGIMTIIPLFYPQDWIIPSKLGPPANMDAYIEKCFNMIDASQDLAPNYEQWNEPWVNEWAWNGGSDEDYRQMIKKIWNRAKTTYPNINLIGGGSTAFNRDVLYAKGSDIGYADGSVCHAYGFPNADVFGIVANQLEEDKKFSKTQGRAGAWQTEFGTYPDMFANNTDLWVARTVAPSYLLHMLAGFYAGRPVHCFWFSWGDAFSISGNETAKSAFRAITQTLEGTKITADAYPKSKAINGIVFANDVSSDTRTRAAVWISAPYYGDASSARSPYDTNNSPNTPSDEYTGSMSIASSNNMQAYDFQGNRINDLSNIALNPVQVVYFVANMTSDEMKAALANADFSLKNEVKVTPLSLDGLVVSGRTLDFKVENQVNKIRSVSLSITPPSGWTMESTSTSFNLQPGEIRIIRFKINSGSANANNVYPLSFSVSTNGKTVSKNWAVQVAYAPKKTITIDGDLSDWNSVVSTSMGNNQDYKMKLAWDDNNLYFAAEVNDDTHSPYPPFKAGDFPYFCNNRFDYINQDGIILALDCMKDNPDDLLKGYPNYEKNCAADMDYQFFASLATGDKSEVIRYTAPGTNYQGYYPLNAVLNPPIQAIDASPSGGTEGKVKFLHSGNKTIYEGAIAWKTIPQLRDSLKALAANGYCDPNFAWKVNGGNSGDRFWTTESGQVESGSYGFFPSWLSGSLANGGRIITRWSFINGDGSAPRPGGCSGILVTGVTLNPATATVSINNTQQLTPAITPANACNKNVTYTSSNNLVATVNASGLVSGVAVGTATITVTTADGSKTSTSAITVNTVAVTGVTVSPASATVSTGTTTTLTPSVLPSNATNKNVSWSSSNTSVATVNSSGVVTGVTAGTTTITVTTTDGNKTATASITVALTGDGLKGDYFNNITLSGTAALSRTDAIIDFDWGSGSYATGQPVDGFSTRWTGQVLPKYTETYTFETESDDGARLWVNGTQLVNAWADQAPTKASATIALTAGQKYDIKYEYYENGGGATARLRWSSPSQVYQVIPQTQLFSANITPVSVTGVTVAPPSASINVGATQQLTATVAPSNATNQAITWSSSNTAVATVSSSGLVTSVTAGTATITVKTTDGNKTATSAITVNAVTGCTASGTILYQRWDGISGTAVSNLTSNANYPNTPTSSSSLTSMEAATDVADNYGARIAGYICAPATGAYTFWIASDDASQLWLSTDGTAANKVKIAEVTSWTNSREWGKQTSQKSATINLTQGQSYYVEALMKEGSGGDNLAVGWLKPGQSGTAPSEVIPGSVLSPLVIGTPVAVTGVSVSPAASSIVAGKTQQLTATVAPSNATNKTVSWSSSNTAVATVSSSGLVTGVTAGTATITVTTADGGKTATSAVTVTTSSISCIDEQGTVTCYKAASTITVDGNLNEASWCISNTITKANFGTKNNTVTFGVLYDNTNLYIGVKVLDANVFAANNNFPWENDGIELYLDPNNSGGTSYDSNDRQYIKAASTLALWANAGGTNGASVNWATISGGYTMEFKIPFSLMGISSTPANNTLLGFDIANDDDDNGSGRATQISWNDATGNDYANPSLFGKLKINSTLKDEGTIGIAPVASDISLYPNPSDGNSLTLQGLSGKSVVNIYSLTGSLVYNTTVYASGDAKIDGLGLKPGVYILSTINETNTTYTVKIIIQ